jgi:hypothetical protein
MEVESPESALKLAYASVTKPVYYEEIGWVVEGPCRDEAWDSHRKRKTLHSFEEAAVARELWVAIVALTWMEWPRSEAVAAVSSCALTCANQILSQILDYLPIFDTRDGAGRDHAGNTTTIHLTQHIHAGKGHDERKLAESVYREFRSAGERQLSDGAYV